MLKTKPKLSRDEWLAKSLPILAKSGGRFNIDSLVHELGVSKGSFYWHFKNRDDFINQMIDYWFREYTEKASEVVSNKSDNPAEQLLALMLFIHKHDLTKYDIAIRSWGAQDVKIAKKIKEVDKFRLDFVCSLFAGLGFKGRELEMRSRLFAIYHSLQHGFFERPSKQQELALLKQQHEFLIKK